ncbi:MAG: methyl-accepting chemotaxis protein [Treponema sp.]|nr:methyl-accepting chemotaxis protein [Treponema sp.]
MKLFQSLKFRFILLFSVFIVLLCSITSLFTVMQSVRISVDVFASQGVATVEKARSLVNGDDFERLAKTLDGDDISYESIRKKLLELKNSSDCLYLYTMAPVDDPVWVYVIDGSVEPGREGFSALGDEEDTSSYDSAFGRVWTSGKIEYSGLTKQTDWGWLVSIYSPIKNSKGETVGIIGCDYGADHLFEVIMAQVLHQVIIGAVSLFLGFLLMGFFLKMIFGNLGRINVILREISEGEGNLMHRIEISKNNEIGELARYFNMTLEKIRNLVVAIKNQTVNLYNIGNELASNMDHTAGAVDGITGGINDVKTKMINQSASMTETAATMEQVTINIEKLSANVEEQTKSVSQSSSAIEEMLANIQSVTETLVKNVDNVKQLTEASDAGRTGLSEVSGDVQEIARESEGLLEINAMMESIADQTNLLSMNAAIEAAHAGEAGKGFAVVADEIRKLAESSSEQSKTISAVLKKIKDSIDLIIKSTDAVLTQFAAIDERVRTVSDQETNIRNAMEEQGQGSRQILEAIGRLNDLTQRVKHGSIEMLEGSREVIAESRRLETETAEVSAGVTSMAEGANEISDIIKRVNDLSGANKEHINTLVTEVSKFKVE